jgi:hypothetical protein
MFSLIKRELALRGKLDSIVFRLPADAAANNDDDDDVGGEDGIDPADYWKTP